MKAFPFQMPQPVTILGRSSSLTNAFVNGIIPTIEPSRAELIEAIGVLGLDPENLDCAYCGDTATEWDHLNPLIMKKRPTGFVSEIKNLVPACGKCNQSKGNKNWKTWMFGTAKLSPVSRKRPDQDTRSQRLEDYERRFQPQQLDLENLAGTELWNKHWRNHELLLKTLKEMQETSDEIRENIKRNQNAV